MHKKCFIQSLTQQTRQVDGGTPIIKDQSSCRCECSRPHSCLSVLPPLGDAGTFSSLSATK